MDEQSSIPQTGDTPPAVQRTVRTMSLAIIGATVFFAVALCVTVGVGSANVLYVVLSVLLVIAGFFVAISFGYRAVASISEGPTAYLTGFMRRLLITDVPVLLNVAIGFIADSAIPYLVALPFSIASMWVHLVQSDSAQRRWGVSRKG
ncbi:hypothetical protein [Flexivirga caeni]|uniref:Uncharacterized protein n=1 Tax=Flexivirga caeni TaxID=2294115 RepID=A0A3M9MCC6_9MICO|nr:hypothetical protein [Flexivirga caeni]RNI23219.1 hypothetical protein EFY87_07230 [Flexivirga caeni]